MLATSEPAFECQRLSRAIQGGTRFIPSGSVIPKQKRMLPSATPGKKRSFCSLVPKFTIGGTPMPLPPPSPHKTPVYPFSYVRNRNQRLFRWGPNHSCELIRDNQSMPVIPILQWNVAWKSYVVKFCMQGMEAQLGVSFKSLCSDCELWFAGATLVRSLPSLALLRQTPIQKHKGEFRRRRMLLWQLSVCGGTRYNAGSGCGSTTKALRTVSLRQRA